MRKPGREVTSLHSDSGRPRRGVASPRRRLAPSSSRAAVWRTGSRTFSVDPHVSCKSHPSRVGQTGQRTCMFRPAAVRPEGTCRVRLSSAWGRGYRRALWQGEENPAAGSEKAAGPATRDRTRPHRKVLTASSAAQDVTRREPEVTFETKSSTATPSVTTLSQVPRTTPDVAGQNRQVTIRRKIDEHRHERAEAPPPQSNEQPTPACPTGRSRHRRTSLIDAGRLEKYRLKSSARRSPDPLPGNGLFIECQQTLPCHPILVTATVQTPQSGWR